MAYATLKSAQVSNLFRDMLGIVFLKQSCYVKTITQSCRGITSVSQFLYCSVPALQLRTSS